MKYKVPLNKALENRYARLTINDNCIDVFYSQLRYSEYLATPCESGSFPGSKYSNSTIGGSGVLQQEQRKESNKDD